MSTKRGMLASSALMTLLFAGCSSEPPSKYGQDVGESQSQASCSNNNDAQCPEGEFCDRQTCRVAFVSGTIGNECQLNTGHGPCSAGLLCLDGRCRSCISDDECASIFGEVCMAREGFVGRYCGKDYGSESAATPPTAASPDPIGP